MFTKTLVIALALTLGLVEAQVPSLGFCPELVPGVNFNISRFLGTWYEAERYFQLSEVASRCVVTKYTAGTDGKYYVSNEVMNRLTGIKRVLDGEIKISPSKAGLGLLQIKYTSVPLTPETKYSVLETDYDNYAVLWSCSGIGPIHTQNAWIMTRQPLAPGAILQNAYAVLDKYKISKTFFVKTDQDDCAFFQSVPAEVPENDNNEDESKAPFKTEIVHTRDAISGPELPVAAPKSSQKIVQNEQSDTPASLAELILKKADQANSAKVVESAMEKIDENIAEKVAEKVASKIATKISQFNEDTVKISEETKSVV